MDKQQVVEELKNALGHLNDVALLSDSPLVMLVGDAETVSRGVRLRGLLVDLIEHMRPPVQVPETASEWRQYVILNDRYVLHRPLWEIEHKLSIGERQVRREHSRGLAILAEMLQSHLPTAEGLASEPATTPLEAVQRLAPVARVFNLAQLVEEVVAFLSVAGKLHENQVLVTVTPESLTVCTDPGILRQLLANLLLSLDLCSADARSVSLDASLQGRAVVVALSVRDGAFDLTGENVTLCRWLARSLGVEVQIDAQTSTRACFSLPAGTHLRKVLVIDDELAAVELFQSYVIGLDYQVIGETNAEWAVTRALEEQPDVIVLDVMMPAMDGWELLQRLRHSQTLRDVPIIVCSVLNEADLAAALGASAFLKKPILRSHLVKTLGELLARERA
jgi:CheY-like chemotaxis protein